eukprot:3918216-Alexandrium_andersonii.AAC.1
MVDHFAQAQDFEFAYIRGSDALPDTLLRQRHHGSRYGRPAPAAERLLHRAGLWALLGAARPLCPGP